MYYIYHIPGVKIGCSEKLKKRIKEQGYTEYEILEEHTDKDLAADREIELQKQYGYKIDCIKYNQINYSAVGKKGGMKNVESGHIRKVIQNISFPISAYRKGTCEYVGTYPSQRECARELGIYVEALRACLTGKQNHTGGYTFKREPK